MDKTQILDLGRKHRKMKKQKAEKVVKLRSETGKCLVSLDLLLLLK